MSFGKGATFNSGFRGGSGPIYLDDVNCLGTERRLIDCPYNRDHNCGHHEDVGVTCRSMQVYHNISSA